jgi:sugar phosphate isomerase/epimerase
LTPAHVDDLPATWSLGVASFDEPLKSGRMGTGEFLQRARGLGFRAVELCDLTVDRRHPQRTRTALDQVGLSSPSLAVRNDFTTAELGPQDLQKVLTWLGVCGPVGASVIRVYTGRRRADADAARRVTRTFDQVVPVAEALGVRLAVETHGGLSNDVAFLRSLVARYGGRLGVCVDFGNLPRERHVQYVEAFAPLAIHVHVKSFQFDVDGRETTLDLDRCLRVLQDGGYRGQWVVEYEGGPPHADGIRRTVGTMLATLL